MRHVAFWKVGWKSFVQLGIPILFECLLFSYHFPSYISLKWQQYCSVVKKIQRKGQLKSEGSRRMPSQNRQKQTLIYIQIAHLSSNPRIFSFFNKGCIASRYRKLYDTTTVYIVCLFLTLYSTLFRLFVWFDHPEGTWQKKKERLSQILLMNETDLLQITPSILHYIKLPPQELLLAFTERGTTMIADDFKA